jgi:hypothetical protein
MRFFFSSAQLVALSEIDYLVLALEVGPARIPPFFNTRKQPTFKPGSDQTIVKSWLQHES